MAEASAVLASITEILTLGWKVYLLWKEAKLKGWVNDGRSLSVQITEAQTNEQRMALAQSLFGQRA